MSRRRWSKRRSFTSRLKGPQPKLNIGDVAGAFTVIDYLGHSRLKPDEVKLLSQEHHWYAVRCSCGSEEIHTQQQLIDARRTRTCVACQKKAKEALHEDKSE